MHPNFCVLSGSGLWIFIWCMVQGTISVSQMVQEMERTGDMGRPVPFSLTWVRCNRAKKTGGEVVTAKGVTLLRHERALPRQQRHAATRRERDQYKNAARDIWYDGREDCVHIFLIQEFNGKRVI